MIRQTHAIALDEHEVLEHSDISACSPPSFERPIMDTRRRALIEAECAPPPEARTTPEDLRKIDLLRIAVNSFGFNAQPRRYGSRYAQHQAEAARATASIAALLANDTLLRVTPAPAPAPAPTPAPIKDIALGGAGIVAAGSLLPALMQLFDRKGVDSETHLKRLEFIQSRYLPSCRDTLAKLGLDQALKLFEQAVDPAAFKARIANAAPVSSEVYREIARQCALGLQALYVAAHDAPAGDHPNWAIDAYTYPQAPAVPADVEAVAIVEAEAKAASRRATRGRAVTPGGKKK